MKCVIGILIFSMAVSGFVFGKERKVLVGGSIVTINEPDGDKSSDTRREKKDENLSKEFLNWLDNERSHLNSYRKDSAQAVSFLREVRTQSSIFRDEKKVVSKCIAMISQFLYVDNIEAETEAVKALAVFKKDSKVLQLLSQKLSRLGGKLREYQDLQITTINAISNLDPYEARASKALLVVVKRDFQATDEVKLAVLNAWSDMPNMGTVDTLVEAYALMAPCPDYLDGKPPTSCDPPDQAKYMSWLKTKDTFYAAFRNLIEPDFNGNLGRAHWKRWIDKNRKPLMKKFYKIREKAEKADNA